MLKRVVLASKNRGKIAEIAAVLSDLPVDIVGVDDYPGLPEVEEDGADFRENALKKARVVAEYTGEMALADDSGLIVESLRGAPGVYSARYAGLHASDEENIEKLLKDLNGVPDEKRAAAFQCVLVLYEPDGRYEVFEGRWNGRIATAPHGRGGFGYDPVFLLLERGVTVAELTPGEKNRLSHRGQALEKLKAYVRRQIASGESGRSAAW